MTSKRRGKRKEHRRREERHFTVRGIRRDPPDIRKLSKALLGLALAEAEREAQAERTAQRPEAETTPADQEARTE